MALIMNARAPVIPVVSTFRTFLFGANAASARPPCEPAIVILSGGIPYCDLAYSEIGAPPRA